MLLLEIIKEFKKQSSIPFQILAVEEGELTKDFCLEGETFIWNKAAQPSPPAGSSVGGFASRIKLMFHKIYILYRIRNSTLVFFNTIASGRLQKKLLFLKCKYIYYIHELEAAMHMLVDKQTLKVILGNANLFLAVSASVKKNLINNCRISENSISVMTTPFEGKFRKEDHHEFAKAFKLKNKIPNDFIIIGCVGHNEWRKGFDLFFPLIKLYFNLFPESKVIFLWKGFASNEPSSFFDMYEQKKFDLEGKCLLLPHSNDSIATMACFDIHLLLSREDPYPLVVLEAATLEIPTVCFLNSGGSPAFIEDDIGICVGYGDLFQMATKLHALAQNNDVRNNMGSNALSKIERHSFDKTIPEFIKILKGDLYHS